MLRRRTKSAASGEKERKVDMRFLVLQDNASANTSKVAMAAANKCSFEVLPHPLHSLDLTPSISIQI